MTKDIFRTVRELLESRDCVLTGNAVDPNGVLYPDSITNLTALLKLEGPLRELASICVKGGFEWESLDAVLELIGE